MSVPILALSPLFHDLGAIAAIAAAALLVGWVQRYRPLVQYLFFLRFPLLLAMLLVLLPVLGGDPDSTMLRNLFVLDARGITWATWVTLMAAWVVAATAGLIGRLAPQRFSTAPFRLPRLLGWLANGWGRFFLAALLAAPTLWRVWTLSPERPGWRLAALVLGMSLALFVGAIATLVEALMVSPDRTTSQLVFGASTWPFKAAHHAKWSVPRDRRLGDSLSRAVPTRWGAGYVDYTTHRVLPDHLVATALVALTAVIYSLGFWILRPDRPLLDLPALAYVMALVLILAWTLPAASFFADRYRVPVLAPAALLSFLLYFAFDIDHYYALPATEQAAGQAEVPAAGNGARPAAYLPGQSPPAVGAQLAGKPFGPRDAFLARRAAQERSGDSGVIVAVAASGGGITASLWTAQVLAGLSETIPGFADSVHVTSSVSGGSAGTMYYVDELLARQQGAAAADRAASSFERILEPAGRSSLSATAWGFVYPDLWRAFPFGRFAGLRWASAADLEDRGWALEQSWRRGLNDPDAQLSDWRRALKKGSIPAVLFNATVTETGERFLISPVDLPTRRRTCGEPPVRKSGTWRALSLSGLYPANDLPIATAARLSATFPYVSPIARAHTQAAEECGYHLADGGYFDNFGVVSLENWMGEVLTQLPGSQRGPRLLLVEIRASEEAEPPMPEPRRGWIFATLGPFKTLLEVRNPSQRERNDRLVANLRRRWVERNGPDTFHSAIFDLRYRAAPLSWHLTAHEQKCIRGAWAHDALEREAGEARRFFAGESIRNTLPPAVRLQDECARDMAPETAEEESPEVDLQAGL